jgi:hypothetical protein
MLALALLACHGGDEVGDAAFEPPAPDGGALDTRGFVEPTRSGTRLHLRVLDAKTRAPIPAMVALFPLDGGTGQRLRFGSFTDSGTAGMGSNTAEVGLGGALATWHGIAVWRGEALVPVGTDLVAGGSGVEARRISPGRYRLVANRGLEYDLTEATVDLGPGRGDVLVELPLARVVDTSGYFAADMHVHTAPGSGDTRLTAPARLKAMAVAGVEVVVSSDHDHNTDLSADARKLWPQVGDPAPLATIAGDEASALDSHFNVFPVLVDGSKGNGGAVITTAGTKSQAFFDSMRALPGRPVVQVNHGRLGFPYGYFDAPTCGPWRDRSALPPCALDFDAMEVLSGYLTCGTKIEAQLQDWYTLLAFGVVVTATGNSDSHGTSRLLGGFPRSYVRVPDDRVEAFQQDAFMGALRAHHAVATSGPFLTLRVNDGAEEGALVRQSGDHVTVAIRMQAASWVQVDEVRLKVNGALVKTWAVPRVGDATPLLEVTGEAVDLSADAFVTAEAYGGRALPPFVVGEWTEIAKVDDGDPRSPFTCPALPDAQQGMAVFAVTNPVFVDVDGDGKFRGPRQGALGGGGLGPP